MPREAAEEMSTMPKGGARMNSGPPPNPNALRRDRASDRDGWVLLPASGYDGATPPWPLSQSIATDDPDLADAISTRERCHWHAAWRTPQAAAWARLGWTSDVALYCRWLAMAELGDMKAAGEARQWSDRLGLNPAAMLRNRWKITADQIGERRMERPTTVSAPAPSSSRERLKAVNGA